MQIDADTDVAAENVEGFLPVIAHMGLIAVGSHSVEEGQLFRCGGVRLTLHFDKEPVAIVGRPRNEEIGSSRNTTFLPSP